MNVHFFTIKTKVIKSNYNGFFEKLLEMKIKKYTTSKSVTVSFFNHEGNNFLENKTTIRIEN